MNKYRVKWSDFFFSNYKWYRKWRGGEWFHNRHIFNLGMQYTMIWEQQPFLVNGETNSVRTFDKEKY